MEAIESVCTGGKIETGKALGILSQLVDKSLLVADQRSGETRYSLLETIRQYAREKLNELGESDKMSERHLSYFVEWAESANSNLEGHDQPLWLDRFEIEHDNLRTALEWSNSNGGR